MGIIVQKFGGSSVANVDKLKNVAMIINKASEKNSIVVTVSAQGKTTDELIKKANEVNENISKREMDVLLSSGEQISIALLSSILEKMGKKVISFTGWQIPIVTDSNYGSAKIKYIFTDEILEKINEGYIVIVAGFQGIDEFGNITTLGRGGSDTTAVAIAGALKADKCEIYTDVDGVFTADPNIVDTAKKINIISYNEMLELASSGAKVLHDRCAKIAKEHNVNLEVKSSFNNVEGTVVKDSGVSNEIKSLSKVNDISKISIIGNDMTSKTKQIFECIENIKVHSINISELRIDIFVDSKISTEILKSLHDKLFKVF